MVRTWKEIEAIKEEFLAQTGRVEVKKEEIEARFAVCGASGKQKQAETGQKPMETRI